MNNKLIWMFVAGIAVTGFSAAPTGVGLTSFGIGVAIFAGTAVFAYFEGRRSGIKEGEGAQLEVVHKSRDNVVEDS